MSPLTCAVSVRCVNPLRSSSASPGRRNPRMIHAGDRARRLVVHDAGLDIVGGIRGKIRIGLQRLLQAGPRASSTSRAAPKRRTPASLAAVRSSKSRANASPRRGSGRARHLLVADARRLGREVPAQLAGSDPFWSKERSRSCKACEAVALAAVIADASRACANVVAGDGMAGAASSHLRTVHQGCGSCLHRLRTRGRCGWAGIAA